MEIKSEADSNVVTECPHDDTPRTGMFGFSKPTVISVPCRYRIS